MLRSEEVHREVVDRIVEQRHRMPERLHRSFDALMTRRGFLDPDPETFFHPLIQPIVTFPIWVAESMPTGQPDRAAVLDLIESTMMGYLYVRVHDDYLDEGLGELPDVMFLADAFLLRHTALLATLTSSTRFWELHQVTSARYVDGMLFEQEVSSAERDYTEADFDRVLQRSEPLVLAGAVLLDRADRWDEIGDLREFVHRVVRAGQIVDDVLDAQRDAALGNHTWVARRLGSVEAPGRIAETLILGELDRFVEIIDRDLDVAHAAATRLGMSGGAVWVERRRDAVHELAKHVLRSAFPATVEPERGYHHGQE